MEKECPAEVSLQKGHGRAPRDHFPNLPELQPEMKLLFSIAAEGNAELRRSARAPQEPG
jgi:hypothetical protein